MLAHLSYPVHVRGEFLAEHVAPKAITLREKVTGGWLDVSGVRVMHARVGKLRSKPSSPMPANESQR